MSLLVWSWELFLLLLLQSLLGWIEPNVIPFLRFLLCNCARWVPGRRWLLKGPHKMWQCVVHAIHKICGRERLLINSLTAMSKLNLLGFSDLFFFWEGGGETVTRNKFLVYLPIVRPAKPQRSHSCCSFFFWCHFFLCFTIFVEAFFFQQWFDFFFTFLKVFFYTLNICTEIWIFESTVVRTLFLEIITSILTLVFQGHFF